MIPKEHIEMGVASYFDNVFLPQLNLKDQSMQRAFATTAVTIATLKLKGMLEKLSTNPILQFMEIIDEEGNMDVDLLLEEFKKNISQSGVIYDNKFFGKFEFTAEDVDELGKHIHKVSAELSKTAGGNT